MDFEIPQWRSEQWEDEMGVAEGLRAWRLHGRVASRRALWLWSVDKRDRPLRRLLQGGQVPRVWDMDDIKIRGCTILLEPGHRRYDGSFERGMRHGIGMSRTPGAFWGTIIEKHVWNNGVIMPDYMNLPHSEL